MYQTVLDFWFKEIDPVLWWVKSAEFDELIAQRFSALRASAAQGELFEWRKTAQGALAEIIVLDQFSRNIFRNHAQAFACDPLALALAQAAIEKGCHNVLREDEQSFLYLPFMHSESSLIHQQAVELYTQLGNEMNLAFELKHKEIIDRFGRYPHRNSILGRESTAEELVFLQQPGSSF